MLSRPAGGTIPAWRPSSPGPCMIEKIEVWIGGVLDDTFGGQFLSYSAHDLLVKDLVILRMSYRNQVILYPGETF